MDEERLRQTVFPFGMAHLGLRTVERALPEGEPPALPPNAELRQIGRNARRWDAQAKVTGAARYTVDVALPDMLHAAVLRSPWPHARVRRVDTSRVEVLPGVRAVLVVSSPGGDGAAPSVRYVGQPVAALAAQTPEQAEEALRLIEVEYEPLPFVVGLDDARREDAPVVYQASELNRVPSAGLPADASAYPLQGNVLGPDSRNSHGEVAEGYAQAAVTVEDIYRTQTQTHCCMEPHAIVAHWRGDALEVWMSTQFTAGVRAQLAAYCQLPLARVRVTALAVGGGFGSKSQMGVYGRIAVDLSRRAAAPVRLVYRRDEEQMDSGNRPSSEQHLRIAAHADGTLAAISLRSYGSAGVAFGAGVGFIAAGMYRCPHVESLQYDVFTNAGPSTAMRGPGNTQGAFALEQAIDALVRRLRDRIAEIDEEHQYIITVRGHGFRLDNS